MEGRNSSLVKMDEVLVLVFIKNEKGVPKIAIVLPISTDARLIFDFVGTYYFFINLLGPLSTGLNV